MTYSVGKKTVLGFPVYASPQGGFVGTLIAHAASYREAAQLASTLGAGSWTATGNPTISMVRPNPTPENGHGYAMMIVAIGSGFRPGGVVTIATGATPIVAQVVSAVYAIYGPWVLGSFVQGSYDAVYTDGDGNTMTLVNGFVVSPAI